MSEKYSRLQSKSVSQLRNKKWLLLVTATQPETEALHARLKPLPGKKLVASHSMGNQTYYFALFGGCEIIHIQCRMGSMGLNASLAAVSEALEVWNCISIVMMGIAFGAVNKQNIGDVLLSEAIVPYDSKRIGKKKTIPRGQSTPCGAQLLNRFSNNYPEWCIISKKKVYAGLILSGESLVDNLEARTRLLAVHPEAIGGEMEGAGLATAAHQKQIPWIIVKSICDFADGLKKTNKSWRQKLACRMAVSLCEHVISNNQSDYTFEPLTKNEDLTTSKNAKLSWNEILFDVYKTEYERAYLKRPSDIDVKNILLTQNLWIWGKSGCGKTNTIIRAAEQASRKLHFIDLSAALNSSELELWRAIHDALSERIGISKSPVKKSDTIGHILEKCVEICLNDTDENSLIVFDEFPLSEKLSHEKLIPAISSFIFSFSNKSRKRLSKFVFSTIPNPTASTSFPSKFQSKIKPYQIPTWSTEEIAELLKLVQKLLKFRLTHSDQNLLINSSANSPRDLKRYLLDYYTFDPQFKNGIESVLIEGKA